MANCLTSFLLPQVEVKNKLTIAEKSCTKVQSFSFKCTTDTGVLTLSDMWVCTRLCRHFGLLGLLEGLLNRTVPPPLYNQKSANTIHPYG